MGIQTSVNPASLGRRSRVIACAVLAALTSVACDSKLPDGGGAAITAPTTTVAPATPVPLPSPATSIPPVSALRVDLFKVELFRRSTGSPYQYEPRTWVVTETSGRSSATVRGIEISSPGGENDYDCQELPPVRIGPGETIDLARELGYCMPYVDTRILSTEVAYKLTFVDGEGNFGEIAGSVDVSGCTLGGQSGRVVCQ
jgi:hypothetical protein